MTAYDEGPNYCRGGQRAEEVQPVKLLQIYGNHPPESDAAIVEFWRTEAALPRQHDDLVLQRLGVRSGIPSYFEQVRIAYFNDVRIS